MFARFSILTAVFLLCGGIVAAQLPDVIYLPFESGQPSTNEAVPGIAAAFPTSGPPMYYAPGKIGNGLTLSNGHHQLETTFALTEDWTIELWVANGRPGGYMVNWGERLLTGSSFGASYGNLWAGGRSAGFWFGSTSNPTVLSFPWQTQGAWSHLAATYEASTRTLRGYENGTLKTTLVAGEDLVLYVKNQLIIGDHQGSFSGMIDDLRIWSWKRSTAEIAAGFNMTPQPRPVDLRCMSLPSPPPSSACLPLGPAETIVAEVTSFGSATIPAGTPITWSYAIDGGVPVTETVPLAQAMGFRGTAIHAFSMPADLSGPEEHEIVVSCSAPFPVGSFAVAAPGRFRLRDGGPGFIEAAPWVDEIQAQALLTGGYSLFEHAAGYESARNGVPDRFAWQREPAFEYDHSEGVTPYSGSIIWATPSPGTVKTLALPCIDLGGTINPEFGFWAKLQTNTSLTLSVDVIDQGNGLLTPDVAIYASSSANLNWTLITANLSSFSGSRIRLVLRLQFVMGIASGSILIDDLGIVDLAVQGTGQAPQAGLATMEINHSFGVGHDRPRSGDPGPYFAQTNVGELIDFRFEGEPSQWVALFWGALNPSSIDYGAIGLCDVGSGFDPMTGLPANIWIVADGLNPVRPVDYLCHTDINGKLFLTTVTPQLPPGSNGAFQSVFGTSNGSWFALSNAVELLVR